MGKRSFLKMLLIGLASVVALASGWGAWRFSVFDRGTGRRREIFPEALGKLEVDVPLYQPDARAWFVKRGAEEDLVAIDDRCPHLGCRPKWNAADALFECPCHGSQFDLDGKVKRGPATGPMARLSVKTNTEGKLILTDKGAAS